MYNKNMSQTEEITREEIETGLKSQGQKLGLLLAALPVPDEEKTAWLNMLEHASLEQIDRLVDILKSLYAHGKTSEIDKEFRGELETIKTEYDRKEAALSGETIGKIKKLAEKISQTL